MTDGAAISWVLLAVLSAAGLSYLNNRHSKTAFISDDEYLSSLSITWKCSVYDLFQCAGSEWQFSNSKTESDFASYLNSGYIPHYVISYVKQNICSEDVILLRRASRSW